MFQLLLAVSLFAVVVDSACNIPNSYNEIEANAVVDILNILRSRIARGVFPKNNVSNWPTATNMKKMSWSCELQLSAQNELAALPNQHSEDDIVNILLKKTEFRHLSLSCFFPADKNTAEQLARTDVLSETNTAIDKWQRTKFSEPDKYFLQLLWSNAEKVGCGYKIYEVPNYSPYLSGVCTDIVCHFNPSKNLVGQKPYVAGPSCSNCGNGYKCEEETKLCIRST